MFTDPTKPFIIAEAGTCHAHPEQHERLQKAFNYVDDAHRAGANAIKFQVFDNPTPKSMFCWIDGDEARAGRWLMSSMPLRYWEKVKAVADAKGIHFLASVFEYETVKWLGEMGVQATKVASRAAGNLDAFKDAPRPLLVSNGMHNVEPDPDRIILECQSKYPSSAWWQREHPGFSDHSGSPWRAIHAMANGCDLVEVHFYIDPLDAGPDYPASLPLTELNLVCDARDAFGDPGC